MPVPDTLSPPKKKLTAVTIALLLAMVAVAPLMTNGNESGQGNALRQLIYLGIFGLALFSAHEGSYRFHVRIVPASLVILLSYCLLSAGWAVDPSSTIRRILLTSLLVYTIFLIVSQRRFVKITDAIRVVMILVLVANLLTVLAAPGFGIHQVAEVDDPGLIGDWRGFMMQKNFLGGFCAVTLIYFFFGGSELNRLTRFGAIALALFLLVKTGSKTSLGLLFVALAFGALSYRYNPRHRVLAIVIFAAVVLAMTGASLYYWDQIAALFDSPDALTGRVQIWPVLAMYWRDHWLLGAGYGSFWNIGINSPVFDYTKANSWINEISSGHNGYLDLLVQIGFPGLLLAIFVMLILPVITILTSFSLTRGQRALIVASIVFCAGHNLTESDLLDRDQVVQIFWVFAMAFLYRSSAKAGRLRRTGGGGDGLQENDLAKLRLREKLRPWPSLK